MNPSTIDGACHRQPACHATRRGAWTVAFVLPLVLAPGIAPAQEAKAKGPAFDCLIQPKMVLKLGTPVPGLLSDVLVDRGTIVKKGDVVARLESGVEEAAVALAKARAEDDSAVRSSAAKLDFQRRKADRATELRKNDNIALSVADEAVTQAKVAESELNQAQVNLTMARLELNRANEVLKQRSIRSPINGVVIERTLGPGEYVFDQGHLITIAQIDPLIVEVSLPLTEFGKLRPGMAGEVYPEVPVGSQYTASVTIVDRVFDAASGTIGVRLEVSNPDYALSAGLKCQVRFPALAKF